jgi:hypothetical protein
MIFFILLLYLPAIFIGFKYNQFLLSEWWTAINPGNNEHILEPGIGRNGLSALLPVYLTPTVGDMPFKRNILALPVREVEIIINITRVVFLSFSLFFLRTVPFKKENNKLKIFWEMSYFILLIPLLLPHQHKYDFLLDIPMITYLIYFFYAKGINNKNDGSVLGLFIVATLLFSPIYGSDIIGTFLFRYTQHYRLLSISAIMLIPIALYCNPVKLDARFQTGTQKGPKPNQ